MEFIVFIIEYKTIAIKGVWGSSSRKNFIELLQTRADLDTLGRYICSDVMSNFQTDLYK